MTHGAMTPQHQLAIVAALRFWQDEMQPHDADLIASYLPEEVEEEELPGPHDFEWISDNFERFRLRYAALSMDGNRLIYDRLFIEPKGVQQGIGSNEGRVGTLLVLMDGTPELHAVE